MRPLVIIAALLTICAAAPAQSIEDIQKSISSNQYALAKEQVDQLLSNPANVVNANAWYYKAKIYTSLYRSDTTGRLSYDASGEAFSAFKKYAELDKKEVMTALDQQVGLFELYDANYNRGIAAYSAKNYSAAFDKMKAAYNLEEYISGKGYSYSGFSFPKLDTQLVNLTASSAYLAKKEAEAIPYFKKLADAGLGGAEYKEVYALLAEYYLKSNDAAYADKYINLGRRLFPGDDYWVSLEFGNPGKDTLVRFRRYEDLLKKYPGNYALALDYAIESFNYTYTYDKKPADYTARQRMFEAAMAKVFALESTATANYIMSKHVSNKIFDADDEIKIITDAEKRKTLGAARALMYEDLKKYSQAAYDLYSAQSDMKTQDKFNYRAVTEELADYFDWKKDAAKADYYRQKLKTL